ncbi:hypothetical protein DUGA2_58310 [Duganella sp. HH101]|nr:hypothetical protein DUGA2_58310 [Duganella sp. HH101]
MARAGLRGECEQELLNLTANVPFDDRIAQQAKVSDLSKPLMLAYLQEVGSALADYADRLSIEELGRQMNVVDGPSECPWPKNVGLMFFSETPDRFFPYTQIDVVWFQDGPGGDHFDEKIFKGPLARITREALGYIERNYLHQTVLKHPDRAEATRVWNFPYPAIEEAVVNAVYHRSYQDREPIEVRIMRDEILVLSYPGPDRSIKLADWIAGHATCHRYRNRRIGEFLKELGLTEGRSTGVPKILKAMSANGSPPPQFDTDDDRSGCLVRLPVHKLAQWPIDQSATPEVTPEVGRLIKLLIGEWPRLELQQALGLKDDDHFRIAYLLPAIQAGLVQMKFPDKPRSSKQRYRLTPAGQQWLKQHADG